jgi:hypothetical protein
MLYKLTLLAFLALFRKLQHHADWGILVAIQPNKTLSCVIGGMVKIKSLPEHFFKCQVPF